ncbi:unnamed protein product, partial [Lampetra fluviatilis]
PSRVLHIRKLPEGVSEAEVISLALPFGRVSNILMLKGKNQAFLEMGSEEAAATAVNFYSSAPPMLREQPVFVQFSTYRQLTTDSSAYQAKAQAAIQVVNGVGLGEMQGEGMSAGPVLHIIVENPHYPVTLDVLYQLFSKYGSVIKLIIFTKNNQFQSLMQFAEPHQALQAKQTLDGQHIYNGCCTLRVGFSKLLALNVKYNNDKSRDYTRSDLPSGGGQPGQIGLGGGGGGGGLGLGLGGGGLGLGAMSQMSMGSSPPMGLGLPLGGQPPMMDGNVTSPVLLVSNLDPEMITPQRLFNLFGVYGDVQRVKILFNKKDTALIQMADASRAQLAMTFLNGQRMYGKPLRLASSRFHTVQLPKEGPDELTHDFTNSTLHRFSKPGSKNARHVGPPSSTLHISNIPSNVTETDLKTLFSSTGSSVAAFKFFADRKMALIQMSSVEEALEALTEIHNFSLGDERLLKVSFSKSTI